MSDNNVKIKAAYELYMIEPAFGCSVDPAASQWGCVFHVAVDASVSPSGEMTALTTLSMSQASSPNVIIFTSEYEMSAQRVSFDDLYNRAKGTPIP